MNEQRTAIGRLGPLTWLAPLALALAAAIGAALLPTAAGGQAPATVSLAQSPGLGSFLVGENGLSLYIFTPDDPGVSNCTGQCADFWPPLTVESGASPTAGSGVTGSMALISRDDGSQQVTYNDQPLYFFANDNAAGDTNGQGVNDVWFVASVEGVVEGPVAKATSDAALGDFLSDADGNTLYIFTPDEPGVSNCSGQCADFWPPLLVGANGTPAAGPDVPGALGVTIRDDGTRQVTYRGRPLYFFANDSAPGDTNGQGVSDIWWVAAVSGAQQTAPTASAAPPAPPSAGNAGLSRPGGSTAILVALLLLAAAGTLALGGRALTAQQRER